LSDSQKEIYDGWKSKKFTLDMTNREIVRCLRGDSEWKNGRTIIGEWVKFDTFNRIIK